ncbi:MAG: dephospho-CoA kinase [Prolixibacteraceae bacterium]|jgi:dephospho-CoA kinase|nr:dephospho-CoA kinase [Prolixibacteraceae bacterium]
MLKVGITGGIGSGKSTVCRVFSVLGIPVFHADLQAGRLQNEDPGIVKELKGLFGLEIYSAEGLLNRRMLASIVFNNRALLGKLNGIIHPAVHREFEIWSAGFSDFPYIIYEAAILFETGNFRNFDYTILVIADEQERIQRVSKRDNSRAEEVIQRMSNQMTDKEKIKMADFIIENNDNQLIISQVLKLDQLLRSKSHVWKMDR